MPEMSTACRNQIFYQTHHAFVLYCLDQIKANEIRIAVRLDKRPLSGLKSRIHNIIPKIEINAE